MSRGQSTKGERRSASENKRRARLHATVTLFGWILTAARVLLHDIFERNPGIRKFVVFAFNRAICINLAHNVFTIPSKKSYFQGDWCPQTGNIASSSRQVLFLASARWTTVHRESLEPRGKEGAKETLLLFSAFADLSLICSTQNSSPDPEKRNPSRRRRQEVDRRVLRRHLLNHQQIRGYHHLV